MAHAREFKDYAKGAVNSAYAGVEGLVLYERPLVSLLAFVLWLATCSAPALLPSWAPLALIATLHANYVRRRASLVGCHEATLSWANCLAALLLPRLAFWRARRLAAHTTTIGPTAGRALTQADVLARRDEQARRDAELAAAAAAALKRLEDDLERARSRKATADLVSGLGRAGLAFGANTLTGIGDTAICTLSEA